MDIKLSVPVETEATDVEHRTITGYAYTSDVVVEYGDMRFKFAPDSVKPWRSHVPVYAYHNDTDPVGKLTESEWDGRGWKVKLKLANTARGTEMLQLAEEGVLGGLSMFISDVEMDDSTDVLTVLSAKCREVSLVSHPAVPTAVLTGVALAAPDPINGKYTVDEIRSKETKMTDTPVADGVELSAPQGPAPITPIPLIGARDDNESPYPHLFGGAAGDHSLFADIRLSSTNSDAAERIQRHLRVERQRKIAMKLAVTTDSVPPTDPPIRNDMYWQEVADPDNPLMGLVNTGTLTNTNPFYAPSYDPTDENDLSGPHTEGVEPPLGDLGGFDRALVTPTAVSGKIALTREAVDFSDSNPQMETLAWRRMDVARRRAQEVAFATYLNGLSLAGGNVIEISRDTPVDDIVELMVSLQYRVDGARFTRLITSQGTFGDLVAQKDDVGRHMLSVLGPQNAMGQTPGSFSSTQIGNTYVRPVQGLGTTNSYLFDPSELWVWQSRVLNLRMDYEVAWVRLGHIQLQAQHIIDKSGIIRLTRAAS